MSSKNKVVHHSASDANIKQPQDSINPSFEGSELSSFDKLSRTGSRFKVALVEKANEEFADRGFQDPQSYIKYPSHSQIYYPSTTSTKSYFNRGKKISCPVSSTASADYSEGIFVLPRSPDSSYNIDNLHQPSELNKLLNDNYDVGSIELPQLIDDGSSNSRSSKARSRSSSILMVELENVPKIPKQKSTEVNKGFNENRRVTIMSNKKGEKDVKELLTNIGDISQGTDIPYNDRTESGSTYHKKMMTYETLPNVEHYKNIFSMVKTRGRPSLTELHDRPRVPEFFQENEDEPPYNNKQVLGDAYVFRQQQSKNYAVAAANKYSSEKERGISLGPKFGWIKGVLVRCLLNIWGVMLFLRLSWVVGQSGIGLASVIVLLSVTVTIISSMSMSAICTNGDVKGGGAYYMISRSLGPEFGGAIGLIFSLANAVAVAMYIVGFAETVVDLISRHAGTLFNISPTNWIRIIGCATALLLLAISLAGMEWEAKAQIGLLFLLVIAIFNYLIGTSLPPKAEQKSKGYFGFKSSIFKQNFTPAFSAGENFFSVFSIFFPAATGILAGANISGDLKNAQKAIPRGTFLAILITTAVYLLLIWTLGSTVVREASGHVADLYFSQPPSSTTASLMTTIHGVTTQAATTLWPDSVILAPEGSPISESCPVDKTGVRKCPYGLINDYQVVDMISLYAPITTIGIFAATLSSALASLVGAPKVFQALCRDNLFPALRFFAVGSKKSDEPYRAYVLAFTISVLCILIAELNIIAPIISNFFLMAYALINYSCFDASMSKSIGFRPGFKYYNRWVSLFGGCLCVVTMFLIKWWAAFITFFFVIFFYIYIRYKKPDVNWGSSTQAHSYKNALSSILKLNNTEEHVKNFRPQILVLSGDPRSRPAFLDFVNNFTKNISLLICGHVILGHSTDMFFNVDTTGVYSFLKHRKIKALYNVVVAPSLRIGVKSLIQLSGLGRLRPNILMMGYKNNWESDDMDSVCQYFNIIHDAFDMRYGVGILRLRDGLDYSFYTTQHQLDNTDYDSRESVVPVVATPSDPLPLTTTTHSPSNVNYGGGSTSPRRVEDEPLTSPDDDDDNDDDADYRPRGAQRGTGPEGGRIVSHLPRPIQRIWSGIMVRSVSSIVSSYNTAPHGNTFLEAGVTPKTAAPPSTTTGSFKAGSRKSSASSYRKSSVQGIPPVPSQPSKRPSSFSSLMLRKLSRNSSSGAIAANVRNGDRSRSECNKLLEVDVESGTGVRAKSAEKRTRKDAVVEPPKSPAAMYKEEFQTSGNKRSSRVYNKNILSAINQFHRKQRKGTIDVWWLFDDGGLTILLPYIISQRRNWENCKMRFFALSKNKRDLDMMHHSFGAMLTKFRIDYSDVIVLPDIHHKPNAEGIDAFESLIAKYRVKDENDTKYRRGMITDAEYAALEQKTFRHIRLHEMLKDYSSDANLIVITLPMPRKGTCSAALYMGWLEIMTRNLPPTLLLRGNQQSVLTFYS